MMRSDTLCVVCISMGPQHSTAVQYCIHIIEPHSAPPTGSRVIWHIGTVPEKENPTYFYPLYHVKVSCQLEYCHLGVHAQVDRQTCDSRFQLDIVPRRQATLGSL